MEILGPDWHAAFGGELANMTPLRFLAAGYACGGRAIPAGDVTVLVSERKGDGMDARGGGRLEVVGGCLGAGGLVIVWPHGTEVVDEEPLRIEVPGYGTFGLGDMAGSGERACGSLR